MTGATVTIMADVAVMAFQFDRFIIAELKSLPARDRWYDEHAKTWTVRLLHVDFALSLLRDVFGMDAVRVLVTPERSGRDPWREQTRDRWTAPPASSPHAVLYVTPDAPRCVIESAFRALAKRTHPDAIGGDGASFRRLHDAYETLTKAGRRAP